MGDKLIDGELFILSTAGDPINSWSAVIQAEMF